MSYINTGLNSWIEENQEKIIRSVQTTVRHKSVRDNSTACDGSPFGKDVRACLDHVLDLAGQMGFTTRNLDGYCGYAEYGEGEEMLGILAHLDVVPEGDGWEYPPYCGEIHDGYLWGRGVLDDKGAAIASLYGLKAIKELGLKSRRRVRIIFGCDEETNMECLDHYCKTEELPALCFSPDADFPLVNSEKNICGGDFARKFRSTVRCKAGTVSNAVAGFAEANVKLTATETEEALKNLPEKDGFSLTVKAASASETSLCVTGLAAHAAWPDGGKNAILRMLEVLSCLPLEKEDHKTAVDLHKLLSYSTDGSSFGIDCRDASGALTLCIGVIDWDETGINRLSADIRAPISATEESVRTGLFKGMENIGLVNTKWSWSQGYYVDPNSELVSTLMGVYNEHFATDAAPMAIGGGTYARHLKNAVAFGPERPGQPTTIHMPNERMKVSDLVVDAKVYANAIAALAF